MRNGIVITLSIILVIYIVLKVWTEYFPDVMRTAAQKANKSSISDITDLFDEFGGF